jgi:hypothetical protein
MFSEASTSDRVASQSLGIERHPEHSSPSKQKSSPSRRSTPHNANTSTHVTMGGDRSIFVLRGASNAKKYIRNVEADLFCSLWKTLEESHLGISVIKSKYL